MSNIRQLSCQEQSAAHQRDYNRSELKRLAGQTLSYVSNNSIKLGDTAANVSKDRLTAKTINKISGFHFINLVQSTNSRQRAFPW